jgi:hypothetical protein
MPRKVPKLLAYFRGRRLAIPLIALGVAVFVGLGGPQKIMDAAVGGMTGFLAGTVPIEGEHLGEPATGGQAAPAATGEPVAREEPRSILLSGGLILDHIGPAEAMAAFPEASAETTETTQAVKAMSWTDSLEASISDSLEARRSMKAYTAYYLRDPFFSLIAAGKSRPTKLLDVSRAKMVGSVWGESGIIALLEDDTGRSYALKVGDRVVNGTVVSITPASTTFSITMFGLSKTVTLEIAEEGEW